MSDSIKNITIQSHDIGADYLWLKEQTDRVLLAMDNDLEAYSKRQDASIKAIEVRKGYIKILRDFEAKTEIKLLKEITLNLDSQIEYNNLREHTDKLESWLKINGITPSEVEPFTLDELKLIEANIQFRRCEWLFTPLTTETNALEIPTDAAGVLKWLERFRLEAKIYETISKAHSRNL